MEQPEMASKDTLSRSDTLSQWATMTLSVFAVDFGLRHLGEGKASFTCAVISGCFSSLPLRFLGMFGGNYYLEHKR